MSSSKWCSALLKDYLCLLTPLSAGIFTDFGLWLLESRLLHKGGTLLGVQGYKKVKFSGRDISSLAAKGLI